MYEELNEDEKVLEVVYVSSDRSVEQFQSYFRSAKHSAWLALSFDEGFRDELKRKYGACAGSEQAAIGVADRKAGIPSFIVINPADGAVVKFDAADDVMKFRGGDLPDSWTA
eukprot:g7216.t1